MLWKLSQPVRRIPYNAVLFRSLKHSNALEIESTSARGRRWETSNLPQCVLPPSRAEPSQIVLSSAWCSKLRFTTRVNYYPLAKMDFAGLDLTPSAMWH
ncbi:hypothetical protein TNCV_1528951 [Trichonephila clavipes]|uniref:Uncharacterized protein n=1 Tax=Trichonephila clavipes TaxID=2585209 RepID=A0A8X6SD42_TRICX|nr:hypothetical protein TNCV_1528951 [Trichonephila clavipes]